MASIDNGAVAWLNSLSLDDARALYTFMFTGSQTQLISNATVPSDLAAYQRLNLEASAQSGAAWDVYNTCRHYTGGRGIDTSGSYPRYQLQFKGETVKTPLKINAILSGLKAVLSGHAWGELKAIAQANSSQKVTFMVHHIAYTYRRTWHTLPPIPSNVGSGGSVAHLCDNRCGEPDHMFVTARHQANMAMQNCMGVQLLVKEGVIMQTLNCPHYREDADGNISMPNCAKVRVVKLSAAIQVAPEFQDDFENARDLYLSGGV